MVLTIENIGKVEKATVELNGITVIAGENNTGKSTVGKVLFSIFNSFYNIENQINKERIENVGQILYTLYQEVMQRSARRVDIEEIAFNILKESDKYIGNPELLKNDIINAIIRYDDVKHEKYFIDIDDNKLLTRIIEVISIPDLEIFKIILSKKLDAEFNGQINNIFSEERGKISLEIKGEVVFIDVYDNIVEKIDNQYDLNTEVIYIDDPFVLDEQGFIRYSYRYNSNTDHRNHLKSKLFFKEPETNIISEIIASNKLDNIYAKFNEICSGEMIRNKGASYGYRTGGTDKVLDIKNISTGLKTFVILKTLLQNGSLEENGTIVLDEPEIHLHPEWQLLFAELIVLIQKEFNMHILLNTHSPYFLNAIEVYAAKYGIADKCKYYIAKSKGETSTIEDVTDNIEAIYLKLARPLQNLENERYDND